MYISEFVNYFLLLKSVVALYIILEYLVKKDSQYKKYQNHQILNCIENCF